MNPLGIDLENLVKSMSDLARRAVAGYAPVVDSIVQDQSQDIRCIEHTLDGLLDFASTPRLCFSTRSSAAITTPSTHQLPRSMFKPTARCGDLEPQASHGRATQREPEDDEPLRTHGG